MRAGPCQTRATEVHTNTTSRPAIEGLPPRAAFLLLGLTAALLGLRLGAMPLIGPDEPRYARVAVEMHRGHDLVVPTLQGKPWLEKPPLYYWLAGLGFSFLGEGEVAARLPSLVSTLGLVLATAILGARLYGRAAGLHTGFILATSLLLFAYGHAAAMDMLVAACVTLSVSFLALGVLEVAGSWAIPAAWFAAGLGTLAKGPLGVLLPALVAGAFALASRDWKVFRRVLSPMGVLLFLLVASPWYALVWRREGGSFVEIFLFEHNVQRFLSTVHHHPGSIVYYVPIVLGGLFPWTGLVVPALSGVRIRNGLDRFVVLWFLVPFLFFSAAGSKLPGYILPCLPPLALLMGRAADGLCLGRRQPLAVRIGALLGVAFGALVACVPLFLFRLAEPAWATTIPLGLWGLLVALLFSRAVGSRPLQAVTVLRVGGAGLLGLLALSAPEILARNESGRLLFAPARGREVLAFGAWRTALMAGYFYNDGHVHEVTGLEEVREGSEKGPVLVLAGPAEERLLERTPSLRTLGLAEGPRGNILLRVERR
jgi:4-amino-4-deoxy-L-arabinose transferase-like glycosyltransferase